MPVEFLFQGSFSHAVRAPPLPSMKIFRAAGQQAALAERLRRSGSRQYRCERGLRRGKGAARVPQHANMLRQFIFADQLAIGVPIRPG